MTVLLRWLLRRLLVPLFLLLCLACSGQPTLPIAGCPPSPLPPGSTSIPLLAHLQAAPEWSKTDSPWQVMAVGKGVLPVPVPSEPENWFASGQVQNYPSGIDQGFLLCKVMVTAKTTWLHATLKVDSTEIRVATQTFQKEGTLRASLPVATIKPGSVISLEATDVVSKTTLDPYLS